MQSPFPLVLQLDIKSNPIRWITYNKSARYYAKEMVAWDASPVTFVIRGGVNAKTEKQSTLTINTIIAVNGTSNKKTSNDNVHLSNTLLFKRDKFTCGYCAQAYHEDHLTRDHIIPLGQHGTDEWCNVITACEWCNRLKGNRTPEQAHMQLIMVPYVPNRCEELILRNRNILADQMNFLIGKVPKHSRLFS